MTRLLPESTQLFDNSDTEGILSKLIGRKSKRQ
jgi:hypothetical protein